MGREEFEELLRQKFNEKDFKKIMRAYRLAKNGHRNQTRDDGARYFEHVKGTALILLTEANVSDRDTIIIGLLHDIREESFILTIDDIEWIFGKRVSTALTLLTKLSAIEKKAKKTRKEEEYIDELNKKGDRKTKRVKLADRLHNLRDMAVWNPKRKKKFTEETVKHILPWAEKTDKKLAKEIRAICELYLGETYVAEINQLKEDLLSTVDEYWSAIYQGYHCRRGNEPDEKIPRGKIVSLFKSAPIEMQKELCRLILQGMSKTRTDNDYRLNELLRESAHKLVKEL